MNESPTDGLVAPEIVSVERTILRALCCADFDSQIGRSLRALSNYSWREPEHATVFEAVRALASRADAGASWRGELPAQATRMGFPDVEWSIYLVEADEPAPSLDELIASILNPGARNSKS